jgi:hypothetical protein
MGVVGACATFRWARNVKPTVFCERGIGAFEAELPRNTNQSSRILVKVGNPIHLHQSSPHASMSETYHRNTSIDIS